MGEPPQRVMRVRAAAQYLGGLAPATLYRMAYTRAIPTIKVGRVLLFREADLVELLNRGLRPAKAR
jgi:excisionase family DNA binding protein